MTTDQMTATATVPEAEWPANEMETIGACPACGTRDRELVHERLRDTTFFVAPGEWTMWRCAGCRSGYLDPRPTPDSIGRAYGRYYTHEDPTVPTGEDQSLRARLGNGYRNTRYGTQARHAHPLGHVVVAMIPPLARTNDFRFRFLDAPRRPGMSRRVLDVGCGAGAFLTQAREAGWDASGVDFDPLAVEGARKRGLNVTLGGIEAVADQKSAFDAVTMSHVIEHVYDPVGTLRTVHDLLRPGGTFYVETPNMDALGHVIYGPHWRGLEVPRHLTLFTRAGLHGFLRDVGFGDIRYRREPNAFKWTAMRSARIAAGRDPSGDQTPDDVWPSRAQRLRAALTKRHVEFLTFTAKKAG